MGASALDAAQAIAAAGIGVEGNNARKRRGFCCWKLAKLGQAAGEGCRADEPNPLDGDENIVAAFQDRIAFDKRRDGLLQLRNHPLAGRELLLEKPLEKPAFSRAVAVLDRGFIGGGGLSGQDKLLKLRHGHGRDGRDPGAEAGAIKRQKPRVDLIGLGKLADRLGELVRTRGINGGNRVARLAEHAVHKPVQLAGCLHDDERTLVRPSSLRRRRMPSLLLGTRKLWPVGCR